MMAEKKFDKQKLLTAAVSAILIFFFVGGFWIGLERVRSMEGTFPPNDIKEGITKAPESLGEAKDFLDAVLEKALKDAPAVSYDVKFSIDSDSLETDGSDTFKETLLFALDSFEDHISSVEESEDIPSNTNFGENIQALLKTPDYGVLRPQDFTCSYIYYSCPSCGETSDEPLEKCEPCGSERAYFKKYRNEYEISMTFIKAEPAPGISYEKNKEHFSVRSDEELSFLTDSAFKDAVKINNVDVTYNTYKLVFKVNRLTDEITSLRYIKEMSVSASVSFLGRYEEIGDKTVSFNVTENRNYSFTWPSLSLNEEKLVIEPKNSDNLLATLTCESPLDMTVVWTSSDESVATVDSEGYIHTTKNTGEAVITATFEYLGKTYSDSCTVYVRVPVESMKMSKKALKLSVGEEAALSTKISPSDATVKTVKWYSENEDIATVDENGAVKAVGRGETTVYALSDDGYYRSTCEVTVE